MKLGATFPQTEIGSDPAAVRDFAQAVEGAGYDYLLAYDHVLGADPTAHTLTGPYTHEAMFHEPFVMFGYLAALTQRIELVTGVIILPQRQTALLAKQATEVDVLSGGRLVLGVGIGWNQVEYEALGEDFHTRGRRSEEQVQLLRRLWNEPLVTFEGEFDTIRQAGINPRPGRHIPIWFGGMSDNVLRRIGHYGDGWIPIGRGAPDEARADALRSFERIREHAREAGRADASISLVGSTRVRRDGVKESVAEARAWEEAGATHATLSTMNAGFETPQQHIDAITAFYDAYHAG